MESSTATTNLKNTAAVAAALKILTSRASLMAQRVLEYGRCLHLALNFAIPSIPVRPLESQIARVSITFGLVYSLIWHTHISGCIIEYNTEYVGNDIDSRHVPTQEACSVFCASTPGGLFWTWASDGVCWVKSSDSGRREKPGSTSVSGNAQCGKGTWSRSRAVSQHLSYFTDKLKIQWLFYKLYTATAHQGPRRLGVLRINMVWS